MLNYIRHDNAIQAMYNNLNQLLAEHVLEGKKVVMFGTSNLASITIYYLRSHGIQTEAIIDNDSKRHGQLVYGVPVFAPENYLLPYDNEKIILLASTYQDEMIEQLGNFGYQFGNNVFLSIDLPKEMNDYSFVDRAGYVEMTETDIKKSHLRMLQKLHTVCSEHKLRYFMCGGTLLGAVRHKGYIPWDDDIDIVMPMPDIIKLAELLREDEDFSLISFADDLEYFDTCSLLVDNSTICDFNGFMQLTSGVSIDIFPFCGVPEEETAQKEYLSRMKELEMNKWNRLYDPAECKAANQQLVDYMLSFDYDHSELIGYVLSRYFVRDIFPRYYFEETVQLEFEGLMLNAPKYYHEYLTKIHGDYMALPPVEKRVGVHYYKAYYKK